jgi:hypothetical protein
VGDGDIRLGAVVVVGRGTVVGGTVGAEVVGGIVLGTVVVTGVAVVAGC